MTVFAVLYRTNPEALGRMPEVYARHRPCVDEFAAETGAIIAIGPFEDGVTNGALCLFTTRAAADDWVRRDPFILEGIVTPSPVLAWEPLTFGVPPTW